jgi:DNA-binding beta-propeller fold protein YncE
MLPASTQYARLTLLPAFAAFTSLLLAAVPAHAGEAYKWTVQYLIDNSRTIFGRSQKVSPRHNRGLAMSPDGKYLYAGYIHSFNNAGEVRRISVESNDYDRATVAVLPGPMGKALAVDDKGRVYISDENGILVYDEGLHTRQLEINCGVCEGLAVARESRDLILYATDREMGTVTRYLLQEKDGVISAATPKGFGGNGEFKVPGATDLRGLKEDDKGNLWIADLKGGKVFKVSRDGRTVNSAKVITPMDVAFDNGRVLVTRYTDRAISVLDENMTEIGTLGVPWEELELAPFGNNRAAGLSGIVTAPGKYFYVANEGGETANQRSTYGRIDDHSDIINGKLYKDAFEDDNEPILKATVVTTAP